MSGYLGPQPVPQATQHRQTVTATAGLTTITTSGYQTGYVDVWMNGVKLVSGTDFTATDGSTIVLASGAASGDVIEIIANVAFQLVGMTFTGTTTFNGPVNMPTWTTAGRPSSPQIGTTGHNTTIGALENYTSVGWLKVNVTIPAITGVSGSVYSGVTSTVTFTGINFGTAPATITFTSGATIATATATPTGGGTSLAVSVPAAIYGLSVGSSVTATIMNSDGGLSGSASIGSVVGLPTGGTITTSGGYRYHAFGASGTLSVPTGFSASADYLVVAGGGGGGGCGNVNSAAGGGGAGGLISGSRGLVPGESISITIGAGGAGGPTGDSNGTDGYYSVQGSNTVFGSITTAIGGGSAPNSNGKYNGTGRNGGSGAGGTGNLNSGTGFPGTGTSGQGNSGGSAAYGQTSGCYSAGGGGGAGGAGGNASLSTTAAGNGGAGLQWLNGSYYAGGGGGGTYNSSSFSTGGTGGGGNGGGNATTNGGSGTANTGGGGGGVGGANSGSNLAGGSGGSGIVIVRYPLPT